MRQTGFVPALCFALLSSWLLISCASSPATKVDLSQIQTPQQWLDLAEQSKEPQKSRYRLNAVQLLLRAGRADLGRKLLAGTPAKTRELKNFWFLVSAQLYLNQGNNELAQTEINQVKVELLNHAQKNQYYAVQAVLARANKAYLNAAEALALRYPFASDVQQPQIQQQLWLMLQKAESLPSELTKSTDFNGWLELYRILNGQGELEAVLTRLKNWHSRYSGHPGHAMLPANFEAALASGGILPETIAVILPLTGKYQSQGVAIRNGLLQALLQRDESPTRLSFYDSGRLELSEIYQQILQNQDGLILGPLIKSHVKTLLMLNEARLPVLALNYVEPEQYADHVSHFALSPESEGRNTAEFMQQEGISHPLLMQTPSSSYLRIGKAFEETWKGAEQEESQFSVATINDDKQMQAQVREVMGVTASKARAKQLAQDLGLELESEPRSRADIDAIYLATNSKQARLLKSFIDVTLSPFAKPIKVMIGPRSHDGQHAELEGIYVADISLIQDAEHAPLRNKVQELAPGWHYSEWRLFATGYDAFNLLNQLTAMRQLSGYTISGLTGELRISPEGEVSSRLHWGQYKKGALRPSAN